MVAGVSATTIRPGVFEFVIGCAAAPADAASNWRLHRFTVAGTSGSAPTPEPDDPADPASLVTGGSGVYGAEPTYTAGKILFQISLNQRQSFHFATLIEYAMRAPATAANGWGLKTLASTVTTTHECFLKWQE